MERWRFVRGETMYLVSNQARIMSLHGREPIIMKGTLSGDRKMYYTFAPTLRVPYPHSKEISVILEQAWPVKVVDDIELVTVRRNCAIAIGV